MRDITEIPMMPEEFKGKTLIQKAHETVAPRRWTKEEEDWVWDLKMQGYSDSEIAISCDRSDQVTILYKEIN